MVALNYQLCFLTFEGIKALVQYKVGVFPPHLTVHGCSGFPHPSPGFVRLFVKSTVLCVYIIILQEK